MRSPDSPEEWKRAEEKFRTRWIVLHTVGAIDGKHIAIKKPKKSGSDCYNYKGFFSVVFLALLDAEYRFLWIDCGSIGFYSNTQIFNRSEFEGEDRGQQLGASGTRTPGGGRARLTLVLCIDAMDGETLQQKATTAEGN